MDKTVYQSERLYVKMDGKYRWVKTGEIFDKMALDWAWEKRKWIPQEEIAANRGKDITEWPEDNGNNGNSNGHKTDRLYKMLYVCPWYSSHTGFSGLDEIKEVGFNTYHTWSPFQWEQEGYWNSPEGEADCLRQIREILEALEQRGMYGCLQMPLYGRGGAQLAKQIKDLQPMLKYKSTTSAIHKEMKQLKSEFEMVKATEPRTHLIAATRVMKEFGHSIAGTVEEPDLQIPPEPSLAEQKVIYDVIKGIAPAMQIWGCFNGGVSEHTFNPNAFDVIITDSYCYQRENGAVPGTKAAETGYAGDPWWRMSPWIKSNKFKQLHNSVPENMPIINIQQGMWNTSEGHVLPNIEEEWEVYHKEFGTNSFAIYPHGEGQGMDGVYIMTDSESADYGVKNQCRSLMKKLDEKEVK